LLSGFDFMISSITTAFIATSSFSASAFYCSACYMMAAHSTSTWPLPFACFFGSGAFYLGGGVSSAGFTPQISSCFSG
jgi:hypothetical protein